MTPGVVAGEEHENATAKPVEVEKIRDALKTTAEQEDGAGYKLVLISDKS